MPELDPSTDFRDDGGTPMWRRNQAHILDVPVRRPMSWFALIGWFLIYPIFALFVFFVGAILIAYTWGLSGWEASLIMLAVIAYPPLNRLFRRR